MKKVLVLSACCLLAFVAHAQNAPAPAHGTQAVSAAPSSSAEGARLVALEEQVRALAGEVTLLRSELQTLRETASPKPAADGKILLASSRLEPGIISASPAEKTGEVVHAVSSSTSAVVPAQLQTEGLQTQTFGGASSNAKLLNPDISLIGDFIGTAGHNGVNPSKSLELHESEIGVQAIIDPYARADAFISFGEQGVNVEEGYVTFTALPAGLLLRVGKMRAEFGKVNTIHNHALAYIDRPLVTNNLLGGEDGIDDAGFSLSRFITAPKNWFLQGTAQVFRGDSSTIFTANRRQDASVVGHLRAYKDLSESTNLDLGVSYARGHNDMGSDFMTNLYGADITLRWKPLRRAVYNSILFRNELVWSARDQLTPLTVFQTQHAFGFYSSLEYRVNRRWTVAERLDRSGHANNANLIDTGFSSIVTYWPSEFSQIRGQYRYGHLGIIPNASFTNANEFLFQFLFVMGAHGAHPF